MDIMMNISKLHVGTSHGIKYEESRMGSIFAVRYLQKSPYGRVAIAVQRRTPLNKRLECPSCMRTKVKTAVQSAPARNWATPRLDETDLYSPARDSDDAERITVTDTMVNISKLHAGTRYGIKTRGYYYKMWSKLGNEEQGPCSWTFGRAFQGPSESLRYLKFLRSQAREYRSKSESAGTQPEW
jgi:hypothetical protein